MNVAILPGRKPNGNTISSPTNITTGWPNYGPGTEIEKEIAKLQYYTEQADELVEIGETLEIEIATKRVEVIQNKITQSTGQVEEMN